MEKNIIRSLAEHYDCRFYDYGDNFDVYKDGETYSQKYKKFDMFISDFLCWITDSYED